MIAAVLLVCVGVAEARLVGGGQNALFAFAASALAFAAITWGVLARATAMMFQVVGANEWSRFHLVNLDATIRDHVGEDKLQIVTFRDRNRFE